MRLPTTILGIGLLLVVGCVLKPSESGNEPQALAEKAKEYGYVAPGNPRPQRPAPDLPDHPTGRDVLRRAFLANGELEAMFHEWAMAVARIDQAGTWPNQPFELGFEYMFSDEEMTSWDRTTISAGFMDAPSWPNQAYTSAEVAWRDAQAAGERFRAMKFDLQMRVLQAWAEYCLQAEQVRVREQTVSLLDMVASTSAARNAAGGNQQDQLRADVELRMAQNELETDRAALEQQRADLNALLGRDPGAPLEPPATLPEPRPLPQTDEQLLAAGVSNNPDLAALGHDQQARAAAIHSAELEYLPMVNPMVAFTGNVTQSIGAAIALPTQIPKIRAMVEMNRADLRRVQATLTQTRSDRAGRFAATLVALRDAERRHVVFDEQITPLAERSADLTLRSYSAGNAEYMDLIDSQRTLLDVRLMSAEAATMRERMLAELEALAGMDIDTVAPATQPANE